MSPSLTIGSQVFTLADLETWPSATTPAGLGENARQALAICRDWLSGADEFIVRTSGSTGDPKPIVLRREQMVASAWATAAALELRAGQRALVCLPVYYIAGQMMLVRGLALDMAMTLVEPASDPLAGLPADATFDFTALVPLQLQTLLDGPSNRLSRLNRMQAILVGGGPVGEALEQKLQAIVAPVYHTYGMTETATHVALRRLNGPAASPFFQPLPGVEVGVDDRGCLRVKGPMTLDRWLQTNDLVELSPLSVLRNTGGGEVRSGLCFRWLGRWDNVINTGGVKVQVEQVESALEQLLREQGIGGRRFFVAALPDERLGQAVAVVFEGAPLGQALEAAIQSALRDRLDRFAIPRTYVYLPCLAETPTGKIDRQENLRRMRAGHTALHPTGL